MNVVSNSGPLIALGKLGLTGLWHQLYGRILIPTAVFEEAVTRGLERAEPDALGTHLAITRGQILVVALHDEDLPGEFRQLPLERGERQAIFLAYRDQADLLCLNEKRARHIARKWQVKVKGTLGILVEAHRKGILTRSDLVTLFDAIDARNDIWIDRGLVQRVRKEILEYPGGG